MIKVSRQVLAEPSPELSDRTWASLEDGTPLVTAEKRGKGLIVLFHVTANANWSNLPLSGLFLGMLQRVAGLDAGATQTVTQSAEANYVPRLLLGGDALQPSPHYFWHSESRHHRQPRPNPKKTFPKPTCKAHFKPAWPM